MDGKLTELTNLLNKRKLKKIEQIVSNRKLNDSAKIFNIKQVLKENRCK